MRPLTDHTPKPLLQVGGHALIEHHLFNLAAAGFKDIVINHAYLGDQIVQTLGDGSRYGVTISYSAESQCLETGGGIHNALPLLGNDAFFVVNGDIWTDYPFASLRAWLNQSDDLVHLVLVPNPEHHPSGDFALADGRVGRDGESKFTFSGIACYRPEFFAECSSGVFPLAPMLRDAMDLGVVSGEYYSGGWVDVGTPARLKELDEVLSGGK